MEEYTCILVDDDKWALTDIRKNIAFAQAGFRIAGEYLNARDSLAAIKANPPDLVITDIRMGELSGLDLIEECQKAGIRSAFIVISGHSDFLYAQRALNSGVCHFMLKPVDASEGLRMLLKVRDRLQNKNIPEAPHRRAIDEIMQYMRTNYQQRLGLEDVADHFYMNKTYLSELFKRETGKSFVQFKNEIRVERAKVLLRSSDDLISSVSEQCGFEDAGYFSAVFKLMTQKTPQQYRNEKGTDR
jgi:YesN/AraC family two-component response regulator